MNRAIFWRLMWKEYRLQRAFWIAMAAFFILTMLCVWTFGNDRQEQVRWYFSLAFGIPAFYALGCASTMFSGEHDAGTYEFQRMQPVPAVGVFWSKIVFAAASILAMIVVFWLLALVFSGSLPSLKESVETWILAIVFTWSFIVWGVFLSLLIKRPLLAAVLTGVAVAVLPFFVSLIFRLRIPSESLAPLVVFASLSILLALVDILLGRRWFDEKMRLWSASLSEKEISLQPAASTRQASRPQSRLSLMRLTWQHWRQSSWIAYVILAVLAPFFLLNVAQIEVGGPLMVILSAHVLPLIGSCTFLADQRQKNYRFFAQRGISPTHIWLSRLWPWLIIVPCVYGLLIVIFLMQSPKILYMERYMWPNLFQELGFSFGYIVLSICAGQLCSMFFRSGLLAGLFGVILTFVTAAWCYWMHVWEMSLWWSAAPIPIIYLLATWLRTPDWLLDRGGVRGWWKPVMLLCVSATLLIAAVGYNRATGIPAVDPGFSLSEYERPRTPEEQNTLDLLKQAGKQYVPLPIPQIATEPQKEEEEKSEDELGFYPPIAPPPLTADEIAEVKANRKIIPLLLEISNRKDWNLRDPSFNIWKYGHLVNLLIDSARITQADGKLDAALEQYMAAIRIAVRLDNKTTNQGNFERRIYLLLPYWAAEPNQTPKRIKTAIDQLEKITPEIPTGKLFVEIGYLSVKTQLSQGFIETNKDDRKRKDNYLPFFWRIIPWERARAMRELNVITHYALKLLSEAEAEAQDNNKCIATYSLQERRNYELARNSEYVLREDINIPTLYSGPQGKWMVNHYAAMVNRHRATMIVLALRAWKIEHGEFPKTLDKLVGPYFDRLPNDPYSGDSYRYYPEGLRIPLEEINRWHYGQDYNYWIYPKLYIETPKPILWSTSENIYIKNREAKSVMARYEIWIEQPPENVEYVFAHYIQEPKSSYELFSHGHFFMVP
jgi:ABC-type transport system involved in multi-copper enzyme maturation permease subunit